jgi:hypothetical protein
MRVALVLRRAFIWSGCAALCLGALVSRALLFPPQPIDSPFPVSPPRAPYALDEALTEEQFLGVSPRRLILYAPPGFESTLPMFERFPAPSGLERLR